VGEPISELDDARDTLRVCALYGIRRITEPPYPAWLAIPHADVLATKVAQLRHIAR